MNRKMPTVQWHRLKIKLTCFLLFLAVAMVLLARFLHFRILEFCCSSGLMRILTLSFQEDNWMRWINLVTWTLLSSIWRIWDELSSHTQMARLVIAKLKQQWCRQVSLGYRSTVEYTRQQELLWGSETWPLGGEILQSPGWTRMPVQRW